MHRIIELNNYDALLPFLCRQCGSCCRAFAPQIPVDDFQSIAEHIGKSVEEIKKRHEEAYFKKDTTSPINCSFLNNKNQCTIYSMRPEPCQLYPLDTDFGTAGVNCAGNNEFRKIVDAFFARKKYAALWNPNTYTRGIRRIPKTQLPAFWRTIKRANPSEAMIQLIMTLNNVPLI